MDADCPIKITRAGYKEAALRAFKVVVPEPVVKEVVVQGTGRAGVPPLAGRGNDLPGLRCPGRRLFAYRLESS